VEVTCPNLIGQNGTWDQHDHLKRDHEHNAMVTDQAIGALLTDLKQRGLLDRTLVIWSGEFGRTPMGEVREKGKIGRNHHIDAYTMFMAGGGLKPGVSVGGTDELGFNPVEAPIHVHDIQATILHMFGIDHTKLTFRFQGRDFRLTDVSGNVVKQALA